MDDVRELLREMCDKTPGLDCGVEEAGWLGSDPIRPQEMDKMTREEEQFFLFVATVVNTLHEAWDDKLSEIRLREIPREALAYARQLCRP